MFGPGPLLLGVLAWTWTWWAGAAAAGGTSSGLGAVLWIIGALGAPLAVVVDLRRRAPAERRAFGRRLVAVRSVPVRWWCAALAVGAGPKLLALGIATAGGRSVSGEGAALGAVPVLVVFLLIAVWIEEPLWRGVALDAVRRRHGTIAAALGIGVVWALWHVPLFWLDGTYQHDLGIGTTDFWRFLLSLPALSLLLTWPVAGSGGAVSLAIAAHLLGNVLGEVLPDDATVANIEAVVAWGGAVAVAVLLRRADQPNRATARGAA